MPFGLDDARYTKVLQQPSSSFTMSHASEQSSASAAPHSFIQELQAKELERKQFIQGPVFAAMCEKMALNPQPVSLEGEYFLYEPVAAKKAAGISFATDAEVLLFLDILADPDASTVLPGSYSVDDKCSFSNCTFKHYGLNVRMLFGQGTDVWVFNDAEAASLHRREPQNKLAPLDEGRLNHLTELSQAALGGQAFAQAEFVKEMTPEQVLQLLEELTRLRQGE